MNDTELTDAIEQAYNDFYDEPRRIHYTEIEATYGTDTLREADIVAGVIDLACRDVDNERERRTIDEVLEFLDPEHDNWEKP